MKDTITVIVILIAVIAAVISLAGEEQVVIYDCRLAEISPDFPPEVRNECRRRIYEYLKEYHREKNTV